MLPDLGSYAVYVLSAYGGSLALVIALCWRSVARGRRIRRALEDVETRAKQQS